jgi:hypothetical protein
MGLPPISLRDPGLWTGIAVGAVVVWLLARRQLEYHIGRTSLRVRLGRLTLRKIHYSDIARVSKPRRDFSWWTSENWRTVFRGSHRMLMIERRSGLFRRFVITPRHRYEFREKLRAAIAASTGTALPQDSDGDSDA